MSTAATPPPAKPAVPPAKVPVPPAKKEGDPPEGKGKGYDEHWTDPMADLDAMVTPPSGKKDEGKPPEKKEGAPPQAKPEDKTDPPPDDKKEGEGSPPPDKKEGEEKHPPAAKFDRAKPLRDAYDNLREEHAKLETELVELKKASESGEHAQAIVAENQGLRAKLKEFESQLVANNYEQSEEYDSKYRKPLERMLAQASREMSDLTVASEDGKTERRATKEDFLALVQMPLKDASRVAKIWFGDAAGYILGLRQQVRSLNEDRHAALEDARKNSDEIQRAHVARQAEDQSFRVRVFEAASQKVVKRFPELFGEDAEDPDHRIMIDKGLKEWDILMDPKNRMAPEQRITLMAGMRYRAAALPAIVRRLRATEDMVEELQAKLTKFEAGDPDNGQPGAGGGTESKDSKEGRWETDKDAPWNRA